jgi:phosphotransferase system HPr (HPr) family protein
MTKALHGEQNGDMGAQPQEVQLVESTVVLPNAAGLHARSAAQLVKTTTRFRATVTLSLNGRTARASSLTELLRLGARRGHAVHIEAEGQDAEAALHEFKTLMENGFDEE